MRFVGVLAIGIVIMCFFVLLHFAFPVFLFPYQPMFGGLVAGIAAGALTKDFRLGILGGLLSAFMGPIIGIVVLLFSVPEGSSTIMTLLLIFGLEAGLWACIPAAFGGVLGAFVMKKGDAHPETTTTSTRADSS